MRAAPLLEGWHGVALRDALAEATGLTAAYGQLAAFSILYSVPVLSLYVLVSRVLGGSSAVAGAIKG